MCICAKQKKHYGLTAFGGINVRIQFFLTSALVAFEETASCSGRFNSEERLLFALGEENGLVWTT
jgi:hypothetical protein